MTTINYKPEFLIVEGTDWTRPIYGSGNATIVSSLTRGFAGRVALVGVTSNPEHVLGKWTQIEVSGQQYDFLPMIRSERIKNPITRSSNLDLALSLYKYRKSLMDQPVRKVLTRTYTVLWAINRIKSAWDVCFFYPGLNNPMLIGRKVKYTKYFAGAYEFIQAKALQKHVTVAYTANSQHEIDKYNSYLERRNVKLRVSRQTTALDPSVVRPYPQSAARTKHAVPTDALTLCFVGRLAMVKGIPLLLETLAILQKRHNGRVVLLLCGDGEERQKLQDLAEQKGLTDAARFLGMLPKEEVMQAIAASDVCVVGSHNEGFSNAMLEQLAGGKPIVSTRVSGADDIITNGKNGFVLNSRDPEEFASRILDANELRGVAAYNASEVQKKYVESIFWKRLDREWIKPRAGNR